MIWQWGGAEEVQTLKYPKVSVGEKNDRNNSRGKSACWNMKILAVHRLWFCRLELARKSFIRIFSEAFHELKTITERQTSRKVYRRIKAIGMLDQISSFMIMQHPTSFLCWGLTVKKFHVSTKIKSWWHCQGNTWHYSDYSKYINRKKQYIKSMYLIYVWMTCQC